MEFEARRNRASVEAFNSAILPLFLALRGETEKSEEEKDRVKSVRRDRQGNENSLSSKHAESEKTKDAAPESKIAQTFMIVSMGEVGIQVQGYGSVRLKPEPQYVFGTYTRSWGVPTNFNSVVSNETGAVGYSLPYQSNEFERAA